MIAIYVRVSTSEQAKSGYSVGEQIDRLKSYCKALGYKNPKVYNDAGFSGAKIDRPALSFLINDVKAKKIEKVLVYKLDRLSRSQKDTLMLIEDIFLKNGCDFVSISENFDTSTPLGRAMIGILAVFAQLEREQIKERMSMGREARAKQGKYTGSWLHPIGYDYIDGELKVNDFEKKQIELVFNYYLQGMGIRKIAETLNNQGFNHKYGEWKEGLVRTVLQSKTYIGYVHFGGEWYKGTHEPIISEELFENVQRVHDRKEKCPTSGHPTSYLGGMIVCKRCGAKYFKYHRITRGYQYDYYSCFNRYPRNHAGTCKNDNWKVEELNDLIFNEIRKLSFEDDTPSNLPDNTSVITNKINELNKQLERLMSLYSVGDVPLDMLQKKIKEVNDQRLKLESVETVKLSSDELEEAVLSFDDVLEHGTLEDVRQAISILIDHIEVDGEDITIYWNF